MIKLNEVTKSDISRFVVWSLDERIEFGRLIGWNDKAIFVVFFACGKVFDQDRCLDYAKYRGSKCSPERLFFFDDYFASANVGPARAEYASPSGAPDTTSGTGAAGRPAPALT
jgi:hypothetical protein